LCPIGALLKIFNGIGIGKVRLVNQECNGCGKCNRLCEMQVDILGNLKDQGQINSSDCIRCLKCADGCPTGAIAFSMRRKRNVSLNADAAGRAVQASLKRRQPSAFDLTIAGLWIVVTLFFTFTARQGAPQELKVTMAAGLLLVIYGVVWLMQKGWSRFGRKGRETL
jgi:polyferredoxin